MKIYQEELDAAIRFQQSQDVPRFSAEQLRAFRDRSRSYANWTRSHPSTHNAINCVVLFCLFAGDIAGLLGVPTIWSSSQTPARFAFVVALTSVIHGFIAYSIIVFSMHEGAAHRRIIVRTGPVTRFLAVLANNACRIFFADPVYYRSRHLHHHQDFGTNNDGAFTNFVHSRRFWISLLPLAGLLDFNDYKIHTDTKWSSSRWLSLAIGSVYLLVLGLLMASFFGVLLPILVLIIFGPWFTFLLDRLRETTEHNLLALDPAHGSRNLGCGFWGLLIGGGPWGQPCHLSHHMSPSLPWYHQCLLHRHMSRWMTPAQRRHFTIRPMVGYPLLLCRVLRENLRYIPLRQTKTAVTQQSSTAGREKQSKPPQQRWESSLSVSNNLKENHET